MARHSTDPAWLDPLQSVHSPPLTSDMTVDVCVIGAGIAGLTTAYRLAGEGKSIILLDAGSAPGGGETRFTTAHLASAIDDRFMEVARIRGADAARLAHESHAAAIDEIDRTVETEGIACGFRRLPGYLFPAPGDTKTIDDEFEAAKAAGCMVERLASCPASALGSEPCLRFESQGTFEPSRYMAGLWAATSGRGVRLFTHTRVTGVVGGKAATVKTEKGHSVSAAAVVVATNTPVHTRFAMHTKLAPYMTYAIAGPVPRGTLPDALFWDTADPYHYIRLITSRDQDSRDTDLLLVGGADHKVGQEPDPGRRWDDLEAWTKARFPDFGGVKHNWSGMVMETLDGLAYIGPDPTGEDNVFLAAGDSGMGLTHGTIAGILLSDVILGRPNPWAELYAPGRLPFKSGTDYASENVNVARQYADWFTGGDVKSVEEIKPGAGAVVRRGLTKLAVFRDQSTGTLHVRSAVCPHLSGIVHWNPAEGTWDCPCHGSRFKADTGEAIHGPATSGLPEATV
jgi:glycine/D-amino acid oxidase-like deaminating enzyme/nitrite reductase/ring-hydroxylating ferredoxin subunit